MAFKSYRCRTCICLLVEDNPKQITDTVTIHNTELELCEILLICTSIQMSEDDLLPKNICNTCIDKASASYQFKEMCKESQKTLLHTLTNTVEDLTHIGNDDNVNINSTIHKETKCEIKIDFSDDNIDPLNSDSDDGSDYNPLEDIEFKPINYTESNLDPEINHSDIPLKSKWNCEFCSKSYKLKTSYQKHKRQNHSLSNKKSKVKLSTQVKKYRCSHCPNYYDDAKTLKLHKVKHHSEKTFNSHDEKYQCSHCPNYYYDKNIFLMHEKRKHKAYVKTKVEKHGTIISNTTKKSRTKLKENEYQCSYCQKIYNTRMSYNKHKMKKHKAEHEAKIILNRQKYQCQLCPNSYSNKKSFNSHEVIIHNFDKLNTIIEKLQCSHCSNFYYNKNSLSEHEKRAHNVTSESSVLITNNPKSTTKTKRSRIKKETEPEIKNFQCEYCPNVYYKRQSYQTHKLRKHTTEYKADLSQKGLKYQCPHCPKFYYSKPCYNKHQMKEHKSELHLEGEKYQCPDCPNIYDNKLSYNNHRYNKHTSKKLSTEGLQCTLCPNIYYSKTNYNSHMAKVHNYSIEQEVREDPFTNKFHCLHCDKPFPSKKYCKDHMRRSTCNPDNNKKNVTSEGALDANVHGKSLRYKYSYSCIECCVKFTSDELLKDHLQIHNTYVCKICSREFTKSVFLKEHLKCHQDFEYNSYFRTALIEDSENIDSSIETESRLTLENNGTSYTCDKCDLLFPTNSKLAAHKIYHPPYICQSCGIIFNNTNALMFHVRKVHTKNDDVICKPCVECNEMFDSHNKLRAHYDTHKQFSCKTCLNPFETQTRLRYHILYDCKLIAEDKDIVYRCSICCNEQFTDRSVFMEHMKLNIDEHCQYCGLKLSMNSISKHFASHINTELGFVCFVSLCNKKFKSSEELDQHLSTHDVFICGDCNEVLTSLEELRTHRFGKLCSMSTECKECGVSFQTHQELMKHYAMHSNDDSEIVDEKVMLELEFQSLSKDVDYGNLKDEPSSSDHKCNMCERTFYSLDNLILHKKKHVNCCPYCDFVADNRAILAQHTHGEHANYKKWFCTECDKSFFSKHNLITHKSTSHTVNKHICHICGNTYLTAKNLKVHMRKHTGEKPYKCEICGKSFSHSTSLKYHLVFHTDKRDFQCDICGSSFHLRGSLLAHKRLHSDGGQHECTICGKRYVSNSKLKIHLTVHTGEKNFQCKVCGKAFNRRTNLTLHSRIHTGEKPFPCTICEKRFTQKHALISHMKTHGNHS